MIDCPMLHGIFIEIILWVLFYFCLILPLHHIEFHFLHTAGYALIFFFNQLIVLAMNQKMVNRRPRHNTVIKNDDVHSAYNCMCIWFLINALVCSSGTWSRCDRCNMFCSADIYYCGGSIHLQKVGTQQLHRSANSWLLVTRQQRENEKRSKKVQIERAHHLYYNQIYKGIPST